MDDQSGDYELYTRWLEIPAEYCPPNHYVLLGIEEFSEDTQSIEGAAKKRTAYLHQLASGPGRKEIQRLLGEVAVARRTLLNEGAKYDYDVWLSEPEEEEVEEPAVHEPVVAAAAPGIRIQTDDQPSRATAKRRKSPPDPSQPRGGRRKKSKWDEYKLHLLSASILAACVLVFWLMNRGGGRVASEVPTQSTSSAMSGPGFQSQQRKELGAKKQFTAREKRKLETKGLGSVLKNPLDQLKKPEGSAGSKTGAGSTGSSEAKPITLDDQWDAGLVPYDHFADKFKEKFSIRNSRNGPFLFQMKDGKLWLKHGDTNRQQALGIKGDKVGKGQVVALTTNIKKGINGQAQIGIEVAKVPIRLRASDNGVQVVYKQNSNSQAKVLGSLKTDEPKVTLALQREANGPHVLWFVKSGQKSIFGRVKSSSPGGSNITGYVLVTSPKTQMQHKVWAGNLRIGKPTKPIAWPAF